MSEEHARAEWGVVVGGGQDVLGLRWGMSADGEKCFGVMCDEEVMDGVVVLEAWPHVDVLFSEEM